MKKYCLSKRNQNFKMIFFFNWSHKIIRLYPNNKAQVEMIESLLLTNQVSTWRYICTHFNVKAHLISEVGANVDLRIPPRKYLAVKQILTRNNIRYSVLISDLQRCVIQSVYKTIALRELSMIYATVISYLGWLGLRSQLPGVVDVTPAPDTPMRIARATPSPMTTESFIGSLSSAPTLDIMT